MLRRRRGTMRSRAEISTAETSGEASAGGCLAALSSCPGSFIFVEGAHRHANHLPKTNYRTKDNSNQVEPVCMQPVVAQLPQHQTKQHGRRDNETDFGITCKGDEALRLPRIWGRIEIALRLLDRKST